MLALGHSSAHVLLVGTGPQADALAELVQGAGWECTRFTSAAGVLRTLHSGGVDLLLLAPAGAGPALAELSRHVRMDNRTALVPVIAALGPDEEPTRAAFLSADAECLRMPAPPEEIMGRIAAALRSKKALDSLEDATSVVLSLANAIEGRDQYTRGHVERVSAYSVALGQRAGLSADDLETLRVGGIVHDIGKVAIPDQILNKPGKLTDEELAIMRRHPMIGYDVLQPVRSFRAALPVIRWHHERPNGKGYPDGIGGDDLPTLARIVALADVFDALSTARSYRPAMPPEKYRKILCESAACGDLDAGLLDLLFEILGQQMPVAAAMST